MMIRSFVLLFTTLFFITTLPACGGNSPNGEEGEAESEAEAESEGEAESEAESESESECAPEICGDGDSCTTDRWDAKQCKCVYTSLREDCNDEVDCTDDSPDEESCGCVHEPMHARCFQLMEGSVCDPNKGCRIPSAICNNNDDCPPLEGGCIVGECDLSVATCFYNPRDLDGDGHAVQTCEKIGGDDCNDTDPSIYPGAPEICDGEDNDCNVLTDEIPPLTCGSDVGECQTGTRTCIDGAWSRCVGEISPRSEICNELDDDCDGNVDERWPELGDSCDGSDADECEDGIFVCNSSADDTRCNDDSASIAEICDGIDNDCNGLVDIVIGGELCNGIDDDCDGEVDENWPELGEPCDGSDADECEDGILVCNSSASGMHCDDDSASIAEICNGVDDDCDGEVDENWPELGEPCDGSDADECEGGILVCNSSASGMHCDDDSAFIVETCNGLDDDCNGEADENWPELGESCDGSDADECEGGILVCNSSGTGLHCNEMDNNIWCASTSTSGVPSERESHTAIWTGEEMVVWGGWNGEESINTGGRYNPTTNTWTSTSISDAPSRRWLHTAIWTGEEMVVWGGQERFRRLNTGGRYNPTTNTWTSTSISDAPSVRSSHTAIWTGEEMVVWGGWDGDEEALNTGGRYNPTTNTWSSTSTSGAPSRRVFHTAIWTGEEMVVWGGWNGEEALNTGGRYNPTTNTWTPTSISDAPSERELHTAIWTGEEMVVWGGWDWSGRVNTGGRYNPITNSWSSTSASGAPSARSSHTAIWTGEEMVVWGGRDGERTFFTGSQYNPTTNTWSSITTSGAPSRRGFHTAIWTGEEMVVWGGWTFFEVLNTGGRYIP